MEFAVGEDPNKSGDSLPWQSHGFCTGQDFFEPREALLMVGRMGVVRIDQQIGIENNHRCSGPSSQSSNSSTLVNGGSPRLIGLTLNGFRADGFAVSPRRNARFTTSLKGSPDLRASLFSKLATSSSIVRVVRTS